MSELILETVKDVSIRDRISLLQKMYNEVDECFTNDQSAWEIKNFIDSFINEIKENN